MKALKLEGKDLALWKFNRYLKDYLRTIQSVDDGVGEVLNYRLTEMQAALGISQLKRLDSFVEKRREVASFYLNNLRGLVLPFQHPDTHSSWHLFVIQTKNRQKDLIEVSHQI